MFSPLYSVDDAIVDLARKQHVDFYTHPMNCYLRCDRALCLVLAIGEEFSVQVALRRLTAAVVAVVVISASH